MAKKKRRTGVATASNTNDSALDSDTHAGEANGDSTNLDVDLIVRAVQWLASYLKVNVGLVPPSGAGEALQEALQPVVLARATKYEEDAKNTKAAGGANTGGAASSMGKKRQQQSISSGAGLVASFPERDVAPAIRAITELAAQPHMLLTKEYKPLRAALHPLVEAHLQEANASPAFRITSMLGQKSRWALALPLLAELRTAPSAKRPKLGAYMRWVRELNVAVGEPQELAMLDAIMRTAAGLPGEGPSPSEGSLKQFPPFDCGAGCEKSSGSASQPPPSYSAGAYTVLAHEAAHDRKPPNHFDLDIYTSAPGVLTLNSPPAVEAARHPVPGVEGAFVLSHVLSRREVASVISLSEAIGYRPDVPLSSPMDERSQNVVLLASEADNNTLFSRVKDLLPPEFAGDKLLGLNRRWRLYRYQPGNVYRKHIDGAWPASGTKVGAAGEHEYVYDAFDGSAWSRLTFVLYLSDGFEGGETSFFVPNAKCEGVLEAHPVLPREGFATVFVHGETGAPLLHEGSKVISGTKYILRTDVIYQSAVSPQLRKEAARLRGLARQVGAQTPAETGDEEIEEPTQTSVGKFGKKSKKSKMTKVANNKLKGGKFAGKNKKSTSGGHDESQDPANKKQKGKRGKR